MEKSTNSSCTTEADFNKKKCNILNTVILFYFCIICYDRKIQNIEYLLYKKIIIRNTIFLYKIRITFCSLLLSSFFLRSNIFLLLLKFVLRNIRTPDLIERGRVNSSIFIFIIQKENSIKNVYHKKNKQQQQSQK